jgi:hypothetical protein
MLFVFPLSREWQNSFPLETLHPRELDRLLQLGPGDKIWIDAVFWRLDNDTAAERTHKMQVTKHDM